MHGKLASEHNFSGMGCNFRVFQGIVPGANKLQGFSGSSRVRWPPWEFTIIEKVYYMMSEYLQLISLHKS